MIFKEFVTIKFVSALPSFVVFIIVLSGCSYSKEKLTKDMVSKKYEQYAVYVVAKSEKQVKKTDIDFNHKISKKSAQKLYQPIAWTVDSSKFNYTKAFHIKKYPTFLVFDTRKIILKTTSIKKIDKLLSSHTNHVIR